MPLPSPLFLVAALGLSLPGQSLPGQSPGVPAADFFDAVPLTDDQLAYSVAGIDVVDWRRIPRLAEMLGRDQLRHTGSMAGWTTGQLLSDLELEAMARAAHADLPRMAPSPLEMDHLIVNGPGGTATINTEIHTGEISMDGISFGRL